MRTLLIFGGLVICVLLVTPSDGDETESQDEKSIDSEDPTVPEGPSEIPTEEKPPKLPCCRVPKKPPCRKCSGMGSGLESFEIPNDDDDDQANSMDPEDPALPADLADPAVPAAPGYAQRSDKKEL